MKRNSSKRLGDVGSSTAPTMDDAIASAAINSQNEGLSDLSFVVGVDVVDLPSGGILYPEGHPLEGQSTIELKHMTAKEEDILTNAALIKNGTALDRVLNSLIINQNVPLDSLIVGDKNALLLAARKSAYGEDYSAKVTCPACATNQTYDFDLGEIEGSSMDQITMLAEGVELTQNKTILITTPKTGLTFELRPMIGVDEKEIEKKTKRYKKLKIPATVGLTDNFALITVSINGEHDRSQIERVFEQLPAYDFRHLRRVYKACMPNIDLLAAFTCSECSAEEVINVPLNATFFWPDVRL